MPALGLETKPRAKGQGFHGKEQEQSGACHLMRASPKSETFVRSEALKKSNAGRPPRAPSAAKNSNYNQENMKPSTYMHNPEPCRAFHPIPQQQQQPHRITGTLSWWLAGGVFAQRTGDTVELVTRGLGLAEVVRPAAPNSEGLWIGLQGLSMGSRPACRGL